MRATDAPAAYDPRETGVDIAALREFLRDVDPTAADQGPAFRAFLATLRGLHGDEAAALRADAMGALASVASVASAAGIRRIIAAHIEPWKCGIDAMRQLVCIMATLMPESMCFLPPHCRLITANEGTISNYLACTLGPHAPRPEWGLPAGWAAYLADLFTWATAGRKTVSQHDAMGCLRRAFLAPWTTVDAELIKLGAYELHACTMHIYCQRACVCAYIHTGVRPRTWTFPLDLAQIQGSHAAAELAELSL
jgi:hypothetical protein